MNRKELLKATPTRQLLSELNGQRYSFSSSYEVEASTTVQLNRLVKGGHTLSYDYSVTEIKAELAKRPHVPNKNESRGLRLQKIRQGK